MRLQHGGRGEASVCDKAAGVRKIGRGLAWQDGGGLYVLRGEVLQRLSPGVGRLLGKANRGLLRLGLLRLRGLECLREL